MTEQPRPADGDDKRSDEAETVLESAVPMVTKTPLFQANNAGRYQRQAIIKQIQDRTRRRLLCYVSGRDCMIDENDTMPFVDLLHNVPPSKEVDLLLHTTGGSIDAAEKLIRMVRAKVDPATLRIVVPEFAKSAGTVMVLGADSVVMSDMSELGPIDPHTVLFDKWQSVQNYIDAYDTHTEELKAEPGNVAAQIMLEQLDPATLKLCLAAKERARQSAESLLRDGMFRDNKGNRTKTVSELLDTTRWLSHSQMISWRDAQALGLEVQHLDYKSKTWQDYWRLYCLQRLAVGNRQKLYESNYVSLIVPTG